MKSLSRSRSMDSIHIEYSENEEVNEDCESDSELVKDKASKKDDISLKWTLNAEALQQILYTRLGNRVFDEYLIDETEYLEVKIAYAKFGVPDIPGDEPETPISYEEFQSTHQHENKNPDIIQAYSNLYSNEQRKKSKKTVDLILELVKKHNPEAKTFKASFIFLVYQIGNTDQNGLIPIIRILRKEGDPEDEVYYIDQENRVYSKWDGFLNENRLPKMRICYPKNGYYSVNKHGYSIYMPEERVAVEFCMTPAAKISRKILRTLDWTTSGILIGTFGVAVASALSAPISAPIITTAFVGSSIAAFYGASRSGTTLVDRKLHAQSINITKKEPRACWIAIGSSIFSVSFSSATMLVHKVAALSNSIGASTYTINGLHTGALVFSGAGVANEGHQLGKKLYKRERITALEVFEVAFSTFLFSNSLISLQIANSQVSSQQQQLPSNTSQTTQAQVPNIQQTHATTNPQTQNVQTNQFVDKLVNNVNTSNVSNKYSAMDRVLNSIRNPQEFFEKSFGLVKQVNKVVNEVANRDNANTGEKEAHSQFLKSSNHDLFSNSDISTKTSSDTGSSFESFKAIEKRKIEEILLNDYKFLAIIHMENEGFEQIRKLGTEIDLIFSGSLTNPAIPELIRMCILFSKRFSIDSINDFMDLCLSMKKIFEDYFQPILQKPLPELQMEIVNQLQDMNSKMYADIMEELLLDYFEKLNSTNQFCFEDANTALHSYEIYEHLIKSSDAKPLSPKSFMEKLNWLFGEIEPAERNLVEYKNQSLYRNIHTSEEWKGVLYENEEEPRVRFVSEFGLVKEKASFMSFTGAIKKIWQNKKADSDEESKGEMATKAKENLEAEYNVKEAIGSLGFLYKFEQKFCNINDKEQETSQ